ncbi:MAG: hypothetical protein AAGA90_01550 [Actinomycetota bacterium]
MVTPPADAPEITVEVAETPSPIDGAEVDGAYRLMPSGATFADPVVVEFQLAEDALDTGVAVLLFSEDGSIESLEFEVDASSTLRAEIDHFSRVVVLKKLPGTVSAEGADQIAVGATETVRWVVDSDADGVEQTAVFFTSGSEIFPGPPVQLVGPPARLLEPAMADLTCREAQSGSIGLTGRLRVEVARQVKALYGEGFQRVVVIEQINAPADKPIECVDAATPVDFADERCVDWNTSEARDDCPFPSMEISFADPTAEVRLIPPPEAFLDTDDSLAASFWAYDGTVTVAVECRWPDGWCGYFNQFFLPASSESGAMIALDESGELGITGLPFAVRDGMVWISWPDLQFLGGDGEVVEEVPAGSAPIVDANTFTRTGDLFHTGNIDLDAVAARVGED